MSVFIIKFHLNVTMTFQRRHHDLNSKSNVFLPYMSLEGNMARKKNR